MVRPTEWTTEQVQEHFVRRAKEKLVDARKATNEAYALSVEYQDKDQMSKIKTSLDMIDDALGQLEI